MKTKRFTLSFFILFMPTNYPENLNQLLVKVGYDNRPIGFDKYLCLNIWNDF